MTDLIRGKILPTLFLAGAQKSGTTTLHNLLSSHPDIFFPTKPQEIHFFDIESNYKRGLEWYSSLFREWGGQKIIAQTSPLYMYLPKVPRRIYRTVPNAKIIFILRNPIDRAYSHYWHEIRYGREYLKFAKALEYEPERIVKNEIAKRRFSYVDRGRYSQQLEEFKKFFPEDNLLVLLHDELKANPLHVLEKCAHFLSIDADHFQESSQSRRVYNNAHVPRLLILQRLRPVLQKYATEKSARVLDKINLRAQSYAPMDTEIRSTLQLEFQSEPQYIRNHISKSSSMSIEFKWT